jgi:methionine-gamma-lyase
MSSTPHGNPAPDPSVHTDAIHPTDPLERMALAKHEFGEHGGVNMSIEASTTFTVLTAATMPEIFKGALGPDKGGYYLYGRNYNPTVYTLGRQLAAMERTETGYCTASGLGAIAPVIMQLCNAGDHVVSSNTIYGGTFAFLNDYLPPKTNITTSFVSISDLNAVRRAITPRTRVLYTETVSNPTLVVSNLPELSKIARERGVTLVVDNTFSPLLVTPADHGADVVVHSLTKFVNGASDIIAGAVCGSADFIASLMDLHTGSLMLLGPTMDPKVAHEISLRVPTLAVRMVEHCRRAKAYAERLADMGVPVNYPGLPSHPQHELMTSMLNPGYGYGGLLTLDFGTTDRANLFMELLQNDHSFGFMAVSLGYFETLMSCSGSSTSSELSEDDQRAAGISPGLVRMSVGITGSLEQRWRQLESAVRAVDGAAEADEAVRVHR